MQAHLSIVRRPCAWSRPRSVCELQFSGTQSSEAGTHPPRTDWRKSSIRWRFSEGCDMSARISSVPSWHSTSVCPWNMVRTSGSTLAGACALHENRNPIISPSSLMWCVGITSTRADSCCSMLWHVDRSSGLRGCRANRSHRRSMD